MAIHVNMCAMLKARDVTNLNQGTFDLIFWLRVLLLDGLWCYESISIDELYRIFCAGVSSQEVSNKPINVNWIHNVRHLAK